jgi:hypothetical protein
MKEKFIGTWVNNDSIGNKSMFFIGKNNEFVWTDINEAKIWRMGFSYTIMVGKCEIQKDTIIITLSKILHFSTNTGFQRNESCEANTQKWLVSIDSNSFSIIKKNPDLSTLFKDSNTLRSNLKAFEDDSKFHIPNAKKYEKSTFDFLKTESCKLTYWQDLIDLVCK